MHHMWVISFPSYYLCHAQQVKWKLYKNLHAKNLLPELRIMYLNLIPAVYIPDSIIIIISRVSKVALCLTIEQFISRYKGYEA